MPPKPNPMFAPAVIEGNKQRRQFVRDDVEFQRHNDQRQQEIQSLLQAISKVAPTLIKFLNYYTPTVSVDNFPDYPKSISVPDVVGAVKELELALKPDNGPLVEKINELIAGIDKLPKSHPGSVEVSNLDELESTLKAFSDELKSLKTALEGINVNPEVVVPVPRVNVSPPDLNPLLEALRAVESRIKAIKLPELKVEPTDTKGIVEALKEVKKEIIKKPVPSFSANTPAYPLVRFVLSDIDDASTVKYFGYTSNSREYYIQKIDESVSPKTVRFYFGSGTDYSTKWTNRASQTYGLWGT